MPTGSVKEILVFFLSCSIFFKVVIRLSHWWCSQRRARLEPAEHGAYGPSGRDLAKLVANAPVRKQNVGDGSSQEPQETDIRIRAVDDRRGYRAHGGYPSSSARRSTPLSIWSMFVAKLRRMHLSSPNGAPGITATLDDSNATFVRSIDPVISTPLSVRP